MNIDPSQKPAALDQEAIAAFFADLRARLRAQTAEREASEILEAAAANARLDQTHIVLVAKEAAAAGDYFVSLLFQWVTALHATGQHARATELQSSVNLVYRYMTQLHAQADAEARR